MAPPKGFIPWNKGLKGIHLSPTTEFKKGQHYSPSTEFKKGNKPLKPIKKGQRLSKRTEFKKGQPSWNKGIEYKQILWEKHPGYKDGHTRYRPHAIRNGARPVCQECRVEYVWNKVHVHHKDRDRTNNNLSNLEILCHKCHAREHKNWEKRKFA